VLTGAHVQIFSAQPDADAAFLRDVLALPHVDAGGGFLIFGLPPAEVAIHDTDGAGGAHALYLICEDVQAFVAAMQERSVACEPIVELHWGSLTSVTLPSGNKVGVYQAHHLRPVGKKKVEKVLRKTARAVRKATKKATKMKATKKATKKAAKKT
jgi:hypothetical protein